MRPAVMAAAQLIEPGRFEVVRVPRPEPGEGQVRVELEGCGVCASNLPAWSGRPWFRYPLAPGELGHEGWGRVDAVGTVAEESWLGQRVAVLSNRAYAEYDVVAVGDLIRLPDELSVAPVEPFGCLFNVIERAAVEAGHWTAVIGLGFIGLGVSRLAARAGARVIALSGNPSARREAARSGVESIVALAGESQEQVRERAREEVLALTGGRGCVRVIECTGHQAPLDIAGDLVAEAGRLVIAGYHQDGKREVDLQQWNWKGIDVVNAHERSRDRVRRGMERAARALAADPSWARLITHRFPLESLNAALGHAAKRPPGFVKAAVLTGRTTERVRS